MTTRRRRPEQQIQKAIIQHLKLRAAPGVFYFAIPNGGWRSRVEAAIMKSTGTKPGVPDRCLIRQRPNLWIGIEIPQRTFDPSTDRCP